MRLHTDFHDYYDNAVGYGIDDNVHYNRFTKEVEINLKPKKDFPRVFYHTTPFLLGFCGEIHPILEFLRYEKIENDLEEFSKIIDRFYAYTYEELVGKQIEWQREKYNYYYSDKRREIETKQFFSDWKYKDDSLFLEHKVPVWALKLISYDQTLIINPKLKEYRFDRIKDPISAFQEISMYLSNILVEQKEVAEIEDKFRIEQHGFDLKKSFRKEKKQQ